MLVTKPDFYNDETRNNLFCTLSELISLNIVPIINTNDAVSPPMFIVEDDMPAGSKKVKIFISIKGNVHSIMRLDGLLILQLTGHSHQR